MAPPILPNPINPSSIALPFSVEVMGKATEVDLRGEDVNLFQERQSSENELQLREKPERRLFFLINNLLFIFGRHAVQILQCIGQGLPLTCRRHLSRKYVR
ncbi:hypothetical protein [Propionivibrio sp.]|uniref:hypothetical protein n=1 Tax=Propionivibrio sp. TaxID=2212460 RepID=UPI0039E49885